MANGTVVCARKSGIRLAGVPNSSELSHAGPKDSGREKWQRLANRLEEDILSGTFGPGQPLPSAKELTGRYGVCHKTLRKATNELLGRRVLVPHGRTYRTGVFAPPSRQSAVVLIARGNRSGNLALTTPSTQEAVRALERACSQHGLKLSIHTCYWTGQSMVAPRSVIASLHRALHGIPILGVMLWTGGLRPEYAREMTTELSSLVVPTAVLADEASSVLPRQGGRRGRIRQFRTGANEAAGATVARHLLALGHRRIGYLSLNHRSSWSQERLGGLRTAFGAAGLIDAVVPLTEDIPARPERLSVLPRTARPLLASLPGVLDTQPAPPFTSEHDLDTLLAAMRSLNRRWWLRRDLEPLVARGLAERRLSAWIAATDEVAMECLEALRRHRIDVPGQISLVGFDDSLESLDTMLTSYNFNAQAIVDAMLRHILNPRWQALRRFGDRPVEIEGFLAARATTGEAATS